MTSSIQNTEQTDKDSAPLHSEPDTVSVWLPVIIICLEVV